MTSVDAHTPSPAAGPRMRRTGRVYLACPWGPWGGGIYKVADYMVQSEALVPGAPAFRPINSRGPSLWALPFVLMRAAAQVIAGALSGDMALLHVNMADGLSVARKSVLIHCATWFGAPAVLHLHAARLAETYGRVPPFLRWIVRRTFRQAQCVVVLGNESRRYIVETMKVPPERVVKLTNGVPRPTLARVPRRDGEPFRILFLGSKFERKGVEDLLVALTRAPLSVCPVKLTVAGGDELAPWRERVSELGLENRVEFAGWVDQARAAQLLAASDVLALPSYDEGLPLVILEALGHGVPVLCTPVGEIPQFLADRDTALFVTPGQPQEIADRLAELIRDPQLAARLSAAGKDLFDRQFSLEAFTSSLVDIYRERCGLDVPAPARRPLAERTSR